VSSRAGPAARPSGQALRGRAASERLAAIRAIVAKIPDPEIPVVTLEDLGILRDVVVEDGVPAVLLTPTYSGCPATEAISAQVRERLDAAGFGDTLVRLVLAPPWTSDWIGEDARRKLRDYGIAPPACMAANAQGSAASNARPGGEPGRAAVQTLHWHAARPRRDSDHATPDCPRCGSSEVESISRWGSTPCKALYRCLSCREPFDYFKPY